jgi:putative transposase
MEAALPWLYLKGVSSGKMGEALKVLVGSDAEGLSVSTVTRLKQVWAREYRSWSEERLDNDHWLYVWADGVYSGLRAEQTKLCALVVIGVNARVEKRFLAISDPRQHYILKPLSLLQSFTSNDFSLRGVGTAVCSGPVGI